MKNLNIVVRPPNPSMSQPAKGWPRPLLRDVVGRDLLTIWMVATVCLGAGLVLNQFRDMPLPLVYVSKQRRMQQAVSTLAPHSSPVAADVGPTPAHTPEFNGGSQIISLAEFRDFVQSKRGVVLDARPEIFHRLGHVPGALSLSRDEFESDYAKQRARLEPMRDEPVVVYCSSASCEDSQMVADALAKLGYRRVLVFKGGWDEWSQAGLPEERQ